jgi:hypothetical protein
VYDSNAHDSCKSRIAADSTMFLTTKRFTALSLGTSAPEDSQNTRLTCVCRKEASSVSFHPSPRAPPPSPSPTEGWAMTMDPHRDRPSVVLRPPRPRSPARRFIARRYRSIVSSRARLAPRLASSSTRPRARRAATAMGESPSAGLSRPSRARSRRRARASVRVRRRT